ncbi:methyl jasmonate esterase 1-like [Capsicum annuum]|nr:methyl jasmonate esterase 1-like [Capsicum annuum]
MCSFFKTRGRKDMKKSKFFTSLAVLILLLSFANATMSGPKRPKASKHFVLVHGAGLGAWSWYKIVALMRSSGHNVTALDLGASGINPKQVLEVRNLSSYFSPLMEFMISLPEDEKVVLVGHSLGGFSISKAMESFPGKISVAVFVAALMPGQILDAATIYNEASRGSTSQLDNHLTYDNGPTNPPTSIRLGPKYLATDVYQTSPIQDWALATTVVRPFYLYSSDEITKEIVLSRKNYGSVRRTYIVAPEDKVLPKEFQLRMIEKNPPDEVEEIQGSDHMPMSSKPLQLFTHLMRIANK